LVQFWYSLSTFPIKYMLVKTIYRLYMFFQTIKTEFQEKR